MICVATRSPGIEVCKINAARGPHRLTCQPETNKFHVPGPPVSLSEHQERRGQAQRTAEGCACSEDTKLHRGAGGDLVAGAPVAVSLVRRVVAVEDVALHQAEDVKDAVGG